jgi:hypothetical protein
MKDDKPWPVLVCIVILFIVNAILWRALFRAGQALSAWLSF